MARGYDNDSKRYGDGNAGDVSVTVMDVNAGTNDDNLAKSLPSSSPRTRAHTHAHARTSQHPRHTYPTGPHHVVSPRVLTTYPCRIEAQRKPRESCVPDPAHTNSVRGPTLRHERPVAWGDP